MIAEILKYQNLDLELKKIEDELAKCDERKRAKQAQTFLKDAEESLKRMDKNAAELFAAYSRIAKEFAAQNEMVSEYDKTVENCENLDELNYLNKKVEKISDAIAALEREMSAVVRNIEELNKTFVDLRERVPRVKKTYVDNRQKFENKKNEKQGEIEKITAELSKIEKTNDNKLMEVYKRLRLENILPAVVLLFDNNKCGGCRTDMPLISVGKIASENYIICENCGRVIYK
jgi:predicted  nucleic acid-binding Zn-ribbon protein